MKKITHPGVYKYREFGIYLYESKGEKKALVFFSGTLKKREFVGETYEEVYTQAVKEINEYYHIKKEED